MKPIIIPVENGKVTFTLAEFRKYMEEAYSQGYSDGCSTSTITNIPGNPYWWREPYCNTSTVDNGTHVDGITGTDYNNGTSVLTVTTSRDSAHV